MYWIKTRTPWDIFKGLKVKAVQNLVNEFESFNIIQQIPAELHAASSSILFIQYALDRKCFVYITEELCFKELYLQECYEKNSILVSKQYRDEFLGVLKMLEQVRWF